MLCNALFNISITCVPCSPMCGMHTRGFDVTVFLLNSSSMKLYWLTKSIIFVHVLICVCDSSSICLIHWTQSTSLNPIYDIIKLDCMVLWYKTYHLCGIQYKHYCMCICGSTTRLYFCHMRQYSGLNGCLQRHQGIKLCTRFDILYLLSVNSLNPFHPQHQSIRVSINSLVTMEMCVVA